MKNSSPFLLTPGFAGFSVFFPYFDTGTQGEDLTEAIEMARDAIGLMGIDMEDDRKALPVPSDISEVRKSDADIVTLVDVDFTENRLKNDMRAVRKNCTLPSWLNYRAEAAGINFSKVLQNALMQELHLTVR